MELLTFKEDRFKQIKGGLRAISQRRGRRGSGSKNRESRGLTCLSSPGWLMDGSIEEVIISQPSRKKKEESKKKGRRRRKEKGMRAISYSFGRYPAHFQAQSSVS